MIVGDGGLRGGTGDLTLRIKARTYFFEETTVDLRLRGPSVLGANTIDIGWKMKGSLPPDRPYNIWSDIPEEEIDKVRVQHRCYDSVETDSSDIFEWANELIERCCKEHNHCRNEFVPVSLRDHLPLRLLEMEQMIRILCGWSRAKTWSRMKAWSRMNVFGTALSVIAGAERWVSSSPKTTLKQ
jgi:hypothetical protein